MAEQNEILSTIMHCRRNRKNPNERSFIIKTKYGYTYVVAFDEKKTELEIKKLKAEIKKLNNDASASTNIEDLTPLADMLKGDNDEDTN